MTSNFAASSSSELLQLVEGDDDFDDEISDLILRGGVSRLAESGPCTCVASNSMDRVVASLHFVLTGNVG